MSGLLEQYVESSSFESDHLLNTLIDGELIYIKYKIESEILMDDVSESLEYISILYESGNNKILHSFISVLKKIKDAIISAINSIKSFFTSKKVKDLEKFMKSNQDKANKEKVKIQDYDKLNKLTDDALKEVKKSNDPDEVVRKYKKQRNILLGIGSFITITATALFIKFKKSKDDETNRLSNELKNVNNKLDWLETQANSLSKENNKLCADLSNSNNENERLKANIRHHERTMNKLNFEITRTRAESAIVKDKLTDATNTIKSQYKILSSLHFPIDPSQPHIKSLPDDYKERFRKIDERYYDKPGTSLSNEKESRIKEVIRLKNKISELKNQYDITKRKYRDEKNKSTDMGSPKLIDLLQKMNKIDSEIEDCETRVNAINERILNKMTTENSKDEIIIL